MWNQYWNIYEAYVSEGKSHPTKDDRTMGEALAQTIGIKIKTYDEKKMKTRVHFKYQNKITSLTNKIKKMVRDKAGNRIGGESYDKEIERLKAELKKIQKEAKQALKKAK
jgi:predicted RNase H-like nuclease (RuvC/YqgF family)